MKANILFLVPSDYAALQAKGVSHMILERDEGGFFEQVITVHPLTSHNQAIRLNSRHTVHEFNLRKFIDWKTFLFFPFRFFWILWKLKALLKSEKIQLIRATDPYLMGLMAWILSRWTKIPFCVSIHSDYEKVFSLHPQEGIKNFLRKVSRWMPPFILPRAQRVLPIRRSLLSGLKKVKAERIRVIPHGISFESSKEVFNPSSFGIASEKKIISWVGRLSPENYAQDLVPLMKQLSARRDDFLLVVMGSGAMEQEIKRELSTSSSAFLGFQPHAAARALRANSHLNLCLMGGYSLIEACAAARPVIAYDVDWHRELIENEVTGVLVKEGDIEALAQAVCHLLDHPEKAETLAQKARQKAFEAHDIRKTSELKRQFYREILEDQL